jgi:uncharacterized repeat protein (TIGR01451 family)
MRVSALLGLIGLSSTLALSPLSAAISADAAPYIRACEDGVDNDSDGQTDYPADYGCEDRLDDNEGPGIYRDGYPERDVEFRDLPPLHITVNDGRDFAEPAEVLYYKILVDNSIGPDRTFTLRTQLPVELTLEAVTNDPIVDNRAIIWPNEVIPAGATREFRIAARIADGTPDLQALRVRAYTDASLGTDTTSVYRGVVPAAFSVAVSDNASHASPGDILEYAIVVRNHATKLATEVDVNIALPNFSEFVAASEGGVWTGKNARWTGLTVSPKGERVLHLRLRVRSDAPIGSTLQVVANVKGHQAVDLTEVSASSDAPQRETTHRRGDLVLRKVADRSEVRPGETLRYSVSLRNATGRTMQNLRIEDRIDQRYMAVIGGEQGSMQGDRIVWTVPKLAAGESWQVSYTVRVSERTPHGASLLNVVTVSGEGIETISLTERVFTSSVSVMSTLPPTGAPLDVLFVLTSALGALAPVAALRRRIM